MCTLDRYELCLGTFESPCGAQDLQVSSIFFFDVNSIGEESFLLFVPANEQLVAIGSY